MTTKKIHLITGGSGYFGSALLKKIRAAGHQVRVFDLNDADDRPGDVEFVQGDIRNLEAVRKACEGISVVHHNVALVPLAKDKEAFWSVNYDGTENLMKACLENGVEKVVHMSSSAIFGVPSKNPVDDSVPPNPMEDYGRAKFAAEDVCKTYIDQGLDVTIVRPRTIMGHGRLGIMQILFEWIRQGKNIPVLGSGDNLYQFVHADDLADAVIAAGERRGASVYNIGAEEFCSIRETLEALTKHAGTGSRVISLPMEPTVWAMKLTSAIGLSPLGPYHHLMYGRSMYFDVTRPKEELGYRPRYGNIEMFKQSYDWYLENRTDVLQENATRSHHRRGVKQGIIKVLGWFM